jgi:hypothetical protein
MKLYLFYNMPRIFTAFIILVFIGCKQKEKSPADLEKANWEGLIPGIDYISTGRVKNPESDSFELKLINVAGQNIDTVDAELRAMVPFAEVAIANQVKKYLRGSESGYIRIDPGKLMQAASLHGVIYLQDDYTARKLFAADSLRLKAMNGIVGVSYVSKEEAAKAMAGEPKDSSWMKILDVDPLPASINIDLDNKAWSDVSLEELKNTIQSRLSVRVSDISFPMPQIKQGIYAYFEYKVRR